MMNSNKKNRSEAGNDSSLADSPFGEPVVIPIQDFIDLHSFLPKEIPSTVGWVERSDTHQRRRGYDGYRRKTPQPILQFCLIIQMSISFILVDDDRRQERRN
jgi:hypothetical protein